MNSVDFVVGDYSYQLRLNTRSLVKLEQALKANPLTIFTKMDKDEVPPVENIVLVLYHALQPFHAASFKNIDAVYDLYDKYVENGGDLLSIIPIIIELYKVSGIIPKDVDEDEIEKNA